MNDELQNYRFCFQSYGVPVLVESNDPEILRQARITARSALLNNLTQIDAETTRQRFSLIKTNKEICKIIQNGEQMIADGPGPRFWKFFDSLVRILVAEHARSVVFVHAGAIGWRGKAIVFPGDSFQGKTTLVAELVRRGATYYSDEYAIFDSDGRVLPFARPLALRSDEGLIFETPVTAAELGAETGTEPIESRVFIFTKYDPGAVWEPEFLTPGQAIVEIVAQTIPIRVNPEFAINVLKKATGNAIIAKSPRRDAAEFAEKFLEFVDNTAF